MDKFGILNLFSGLFNKTDNENRTVFGGFKDGNGANAAETESGNKNGISSLLSGLLSSLSKNNSENFSRPPTNTVSSHPLNNVPKMPPLKNLEKTVTCHDEFVKRVMAKNKPHTLGHK